MTTKNIVISNVRHPMENFFLREVIFEEGFNVIGAIKYDLSNQKDMKEYQNICILAGVEFDEGELKGKAMRAIISQGKLEAIGHRKFDMFILVNDGEEIQSETRCRENLEK